MKKNSMLKSSVLAIAAIMGLSLQSCHDEEEDAVITIYDAPSFKATNISVSSDKEITASDNKASSDITYNLVIVKK